MHPTHVKDGAGHNACAQPSTGESPQFTGNRVEIQPDYRQPEAPGCTRRALSLSIDRPAQSLAWRIEPDQRRGSLGLHVGSGRPGPGHLASSVWLTPDAAEAVALALLEAVAAWRVEQAAVAWTTPAGREGAQNG